jgi:ribonuclease BN (tRNA processing enzyme)
LGYTCKQRQQSPNGDIVLRIRFLGTHTAESKNTRLVSFLIDDVLAVEAGSLTTELTFSEQKRISAILLSHGHYDHIRAIPSLAFNNSDRNIKILAIPETLKVLSFSLLNGAVYPNFADSGSYLRKSVLELCPLTFLEPVEVEDYRILPVSVRHAMPAVGFEITAKDGRRLFYTGDTGPGLSDVWQRIQPHHLIAEMTFPNCLAQMAKDTGHLCPQSLAGELAEFKRIRGYLPDCTLVHVTPQFEEEIREDVEKAAKEHELSIAFASEGDVIVV